jgi:hypothetical protein
MPGYVTKALAHFQHPHLSRARINPTHMPNQIMGQRCSMPRQRTQPPPLDKAGKKFIQEVCRVFLFLARGVDGGLLPALSALANRQTQRNKQWSYVSNFWVTWHHRTKQYSPTKQATWSWQSTATPSTYPNQRHAAARADTCLWQGDTTYQQIMGPSSIFRKLYRQSCNLPWRRNSAPSSSAQKPPSQCTTCSKNSATPNHQHQCKQTTKPQMTYSTTKSCQRHYRQWTCVSTGYNVAMHRDNSDITGDWAHRAWQIISPSITQQVTTRPTDPLS